MRTPRRRGQHSWYEDQPHGTNPTGNVPLSDRRPDQVLYGPKGEVILRIEDRPFLGYHRDNGRGVNVQNPAIGPHVAPGSTQRAERYPTTPETAGGN